MYKKITRIIDTVFVNLALYILAFIWIRYYTPSLTAAVLLSLAVTMVLFILYKIIKKDKDSPESLKEAEEIRKYTDTMLFLPEEDRSEFLCKLLSSEYPKIKRGSENLLSAAGIAVVTLFQPDPLKIGDVIKSCVLAGEQGVGKVLIAAVDIPDEVKKYAALVTFYQVEFLSAKDIYQRMKAQNIFPDRIYTVKKRRAGVKEILNAFFNRKRAKGFFFAALIVFVSSLLVPFKLYYMISASVLFAISIICMVLK